MLPGQKSFGDYLGCDYWASHAGTEMWRDWNEEVVRADFKQLSDAGMTALRVFPNWRDFQPLRLLNTFMGFERELRFDERTPLPETWPGREGVSELMLERFRRLCEIAEENGLKLIVAIVTGWMSGSIFTPPAFDGRNIIREPLAVEWQLRFVKAFVAALKDEKAIAVWEIGNECNCMAKVESRSEAWLWANAVVSAIRLADPSRPVASGMHGLQPGSRTEFDNWSPKNWTIEDQGELTDLMTSHPYPHSPSKRAARVDRVASFRSVFQAVVETRSYSDIGGKPGLIEEIGTFGPTVCDERTQAEFIRNVLWNGFAHDCGGLLWWCAYDQNRLDFPPYEWNAGERQLGVFRADRSPKPVAAEFKRLQERLAEMPFGKLPAFKREAVCVLTRSQEFDDGISNAWSSFVLAKQAGFDIEFQYSGDPLKDASLYLLPGLKSGTALSSRRFAALMAKVEAGATLYVSLDDAQLEPFAEAFGLRVVNRMERQDEAVFKFEEREFPCAAPYKLELESEGAEILARETGGNPVFARFEKGAGEVFFMSLPVEKALAAKPSAFEPEAKPYYKLYESIGAKALAGRIVRRDNPVITATEHHFDDGSAAVVMVSNVAWTESATLSVAKGWRIKDCLRGESLAGDKLTLEGRDAAVLLLERA